MPFDVKMPDGTTVKNVPDGTSKQQFMEKYNSNMSKGAPTPPQPNEVKPPEAPGFMDRVGADIDKRRAMGQEILQKQAPGIEQGLQLTGKVGAGLVNDVVGEAAKSAYGALPEGVKEKVSGGLQKVMSSDAGRFALSLAQKGGDAYKKWAEQNPRISRDIEAVVDIASAIPSTGIASKVAGEASAVSPIVKGIATPSNAKIDALVDTMHRGATATIEKAKNGGVVFDPHVGQKLLADVDTIPDLGTAGERANRKSTVQAVDEMRKSVEGGDTSLRNLLGFRDKLTNIASSGGQDGSAALKVRKQLDETIKDAHKSNSFTAADPKAIGLVEDFRKQWGAYKMGESVADAVKLADESPAKSKGAFKKIVDSDYFQTLSPEVKTLVKTAARGKTSGNILGAIGSIKQILNVGGLQAKLPLLEGGAALLTGHPGVAAGIGGVLAASGAAKQIQRGTAMDVLNAIRNGK